MNIKGNKSEKFTKTPHGLISDNRLTATDKIVYIALRSFAYGNKTDCWPALETLSKRSNIDKKNLSRHLKKLQEFKYISIVRGERVCNSYKILPQPDFSETPPQIDASENSQKDVGRIVNSTTSGRQSDDSTIVNITTVGHHPDDLLSSPLSVFRVFRTNCRVN